MIKKQLFRKKGDFLLCMTAVFIISGLVAKGTHALWESKAGYNLHG